MSKTIKLNDGWLYCEDGVPKDREIDRIMNVSTEFYNEPYSTTVKYKNTFGGSWLELSTGTNYHETCFIENVWREVTKPDMELTKLSEKELKIELFIKDLERQYSKETIEWCLKTLHYRYEKDKQANEK